MKSQNKEAKSYYIIHLINYWVLKEEEDKMRYFILTFISTFT